MSTFFRFHTEASQNFIAFTQVFNFYQQNKTSTQFFRSFLFITFLFVEKFILAVSTYFVRMDFGVFSYK